VCYAKLGGLVYKLTLVRLFIRFNYILSYSAGCPSNAPPVSLDDQLRFAKDAIPAFSAFINTLRGAAGQIEGICGRPPFLITTAADGVANILCKGGLLLRRVRLYFKCDNWYPLYEGLVYETLCYTGTEGFAWVASTQFVIVFMTMVILTLRITFYEVQVVGEEKEESGDDYEEYSYSLAIPPQASKDAPADDSTIHLDAPITHSVEPKQPQVEIMDVGAGEKGQEQPI
jgi:hypothetical protein